MTFNQWKKYEGEIELEEVTVHYIVSWVRDDPKDTVQIDEIEDAWVNDKDCNEVQGYYEEHQTKLDDLIIEDAYKHEPDDWETPSYEEILEARAEEQYEAMQIERHFA